MVEYDYICVTEGNNVYIKKEKTQNYSKYQGIYGRSTSLTLTAVKLCVPDLISVKVTWISSY